MKKNSDIIYNEKNKYTFSEEKYIIQALNLAKNLGYSLSADNQIFLKSLRNQGQYKKVIPKDPKRKKAHKSVQFHHSTQDHFYQPEVNILYLYTSQAEIMQNCFNCSKKDLTLLY